MRIQKLRIKLGSQVINLNIYDDRDPRIQKLLELSTDASADLTVSVKCTPEAAQLVGDLKYAARPNLETFNDVELTLLQKLNAEINTSLLSVRTRNFLNNAKIVYVWQLCSLTDTQLLKTRNLGGKSRKEIKDLLAEKGLEIGMKTRVDKFTDRLTKSDAL